MFIRLIRWLRGFVRFEVVGRFPERFMNLCMRQGRMLFDAGPENGVFKGSLFISDYKEIRSLAKKSRVRLKICERHGLPFAIKRYKGRAGLFTGIILFILISTVLQNFIWTVEINGIETISSTYLRSLLKEYGVYEGAYKGNADIKLTQLRLMQQVEEVGWMSINDRGTCMQIEIEEKAKVPYITQPDVPCNVKAECDGIILSMNVKNGSTKLVAGSAVIKGQLLVSGVTENLEKVHFVHADAQVMAQTWHSVTNVVQKSGVYKQPDKIIKRSELRFLWFSLPCTVTSIKDSYTSRVESQRICLNSQLLLAGKDTEYCTIYKDSEYTYSSQQAKDMLNVKDYMYRLFTLKDCLNIEASSSVSETQTKVTSYIKYTCVEDIAYQENIIVN